MKIQSLVMSCCAAIALYSCTPAPTPVTTPTQGATDSISIQNPASSLINTDDGAVSIDLSQSISMTNGVSPIYSWDLGDGSNPIVTSTPFLNHQLATSGQYQLTLTISDRNNNAPDQEIKMTVVYLAEAFTTDFSYTTNALEVSFSSSFTGDSSQVNYTWNFGDTQTSTLANPIHSYSTPGNYQVSLVAVNNKGEQVNASYSVSVTSTQNKAPIAAISNANNDYLTVDVSAVGSMDPDGTAITYTWDFGDGTVLENEGVSVSHTYAFSGMYTITVKVSDGELTDTATHVIEVQEDPAAKPVYYSLFEEAYYAFLSTDCARCHYTESGFSRFNLGTTQANINLNTAEAGLVKLLETPDGFDKVFTNPVQGLNMHPIVLTGENEQTWRDLMDQMRIFIDIKNNVDPVAVIKTPIIIDGLNVSVDASSTTDADQDSLSFSWDFNSEATKLGEIVNYTFETQGNKTITLTVTDGKGGSHVVSETVTLVKPNSAPNPAFDFTTDMLQASFDATGSSDEESDSFTYQWDFGDTNTQAASNLATATHTYSQAGSYEVTLTTADAFGSKSITQTVSVSTQANADPIADFEATVNNLSVTLKSTSTDPDGDALTYEWVIDSQIISQTALDSYLFASSGEKSITLNIRDERGATATITKTVTIENQAPTANFLVNKNFTEVTFDASSSLDLENDDLSYAWDFGDTQSGSGKVATHNYATPGTYTVVLEVSDAFASNTISREVEVMLPANSAPRASFTVSNVEKTFTFDASGSFDSDDDDLTYSWDFDDTNSDTGVNVTHTFVGEADFNVTLTVSDGVLVGSKTIKVSTKPKLIGNPVTGEQLYNQNCLSCHEEYGVGNEQYDPIAINRYLDGLDDLEVKIATTMPPNDIAACEGQCAADIQAYMMTWERVVTVYSCPAEKVDAVKYGPRQMRLLTIEEYANTIKDLIGYEVDKSKLIGNSKIHEFSNHTKTQMDFNRFKAFEALAEVIADDAALTDFVNVKGAGNCIAGGDCSGAFTGEVLPRAFRRPATQAEEAAYLLAFDNRDSGTEGNAKDGMHLAVRTMLMSPYFLYRSELGMNKAEFETYIADAPAMYKATTTPVSRPMTDFGAYHPGGTKATTQMDHNVDWQITQSMQEGTLVVIRFKGNTSNVVIKVGTQELYNGPSPENYKTMKFLVNGLTGDQTFSIKAPYENNTANYLDKLEFSLGEEVEFVVPQMDDDAYALTPYEMATFLAYTYTGSTPDDELLGAANEGLFTDEEVQAQIDRLLATQKSKEHFGEFAAQWLTTDEVLKADKDELLFPTYTDNVKAAMAQEVREIVADVIFDDSVPFSKLYDSDYTFVNQTLADFYGIGGVTGDEFVKAQAPGRGGLVTSGAFLSAWTSPTETKLIIRGVRLRERFLCQHLPPFPSNVDLAEVRLAQQAEVERISDLNNGQIRQSHLDFINTDVDACKSCHEYIINPLGLGLEDFDAAGLPRTNYANGLSVNFEGFEPEKANHQSVLYGIEDIFDSSQQRVFQGAENLGEVLATEDITRACMVEMSFRYMMGTGPDEYDHENPDAILMTDSEREDYACTTDAMLDQMNTNNDNPKAALLEFGLSDIVRFRKIRNR